MLFSRNQVADEGKRQIMRDVAAVAGRKGAFFAGLGEVETVKLGSRDARNARNEQRPDRAWRSLRETS
jgi:hypothetical protein